MQFTHLRKTFLMALVVSLLLQLWTAAGISYAAASGPVKVSTYPAKNDSAVPANAKLKLMFDEAVTRGSGAVEVRNSSTNVAVASTVSISGNTVTISPNVNLTSGNSYYIYIESNAFFNTSGKAYAGINNATEWNFDVIPIDTTPPTATLSPLNGGTMLSTEPLKLTFSEPVFAATGYIRITRVGSTDTQVIPVLSSAVVRDADQRTFTIQPPTRLISGQSYQVSIDSNAFVDVVGLPYVPTGWSFTTLAPAVAPPTSLSPADNAYGVSTGALNALMNFPGAMQKGTSGTIQLKRISDNVTVDSINMATQSSRVTLSNGNTAIGIQFTALAANTGYYILIDPGVLLDASGNVYEGIIDATTWNFTTQPLADTTPPTVITLMPANGGAITAINGPLTIKFSEPVKVGSGSIVIQRTTAPTGVYCSIPVTSGAIVGSGTDTLTITPSSTAAGCGSFAQNAQYSVLIGNQAITDLAGNYYAGNISSPWTFRIASDTVAPELVSTSPASGNQAVKTSATFTMTFSKDIDVPNGFAELIPTTGAKVTAQIVRDATDLRKASFTVTGLQSAMTYVVRIPNTAITDLAQNPFPGILNDYRWTFKTIGSDKTPPVVSSVAMDGSNVVLTYNKELDPDHTPYPGNYYVTVNDVPKQVNGVTVAGSTVRLTLQSGVTVGQVVKVFYTLDADTNRRLQDLSGNYAAALNGQAVTNTSDTTLPRPSSGILAGSSLVLTFNKSLQSISNFNASQFSVKINGYSQNVYAATISGSTITLSLYNVPTSGQSVSVSYVPGSTPIRDASGNAALAFTDFYVQSTNDTTPPALSNATLVGTVLRLNYNEGLLPTSVPLKSSFSVISNGQAVTISSVAITNNTVELTLAQTVALGAVVYVSYIPSSPGIFDLSGNPAPAINSQLVTVSSSLTDFNMATVSGNVVTIFYNNSLNQSYTPYSSQYYVRSGSNYYGVTSVTVLSTSVLLTLSTTVASGQAITVSYNSSGIPLRDSSNAVLSSFSDKAVINTDGSNGGTITTPVNLPDYLESDGTGGIRFIASKAATTEWASLSSGRSGNRYVIDGAKLLSAYDLIRSGSSNGISKPVLTFKVPTTETVGMISVPINSLMDASARAANASLRLEYGDLQFTLPLTAINYSKELYMSNTNAASARLLLTIEKTQDSNLTSAINLQAAQMLASPVDFTAKIKSGNAERTVDNYDAYVTRTFNISSFSGSSNEVAVVRYDSDAADMLYVPTRITTSGSNATIDFKRKSNSIYTVVRRPVSYTDMTKHWANATVSKLASKFIVKGPTQKTFAPDKNITRADFAEYLARGLGLNGDKSSAARYLDVSPSNSSAAFIGAVSKAGIVEGGNDGNFRPNASITREEMATMLVRAMNYAGVSTVSTATALNAFKDKGKVSTWAKDGMSICVMAGFIKGASPTELKPQSNATRAEAATMLERFLQYAELL